MKYYLVKTDPETYSIDNFAKENVTLWEGVTNPTAMKFLREMKREDQVFIYHSGEKTIVGLAKVVEEGQVPKLKFLRKFNEPFATLKQIKESGEFPDLRLVRQSRLSVMGLPQEFVDWLLQIV